MYHLNSLIPKNSNAASTVIITQGKVRS